MTRRAAFLDRDGVINRAIVRAGKPYPPQHLEELEILPGVPEALARLRTAGYLNIVVTNQPDVARGKQQRSVVESMHALLGATLAIDAFYVCWHDDNDACDCRKPLPGLLIAAARELSIDLPASVMIGDRWRDIAAGQRAGCHTIWLKSGYQEPDPKPPIDLIADRLDAAVDWMLKASEKVNT